MGSFLRPGVLQCKLEANHNPTASLICQQHIPLHDVWIWLLCREQQRPEAGPGICPHRRTTHIEERQAGRCFR